MQKERRQVISFFLKGILLGFLVAVPVGPIALLCIQRTLQFGMLSGFLTGVGSAIADTTYAGIAAFSLTLVDDFLLAWEFWLESVAVVFLLYLGLKLLFTSIPTHSGDVPHKNLPNDIISSFALTVINPMAILVFLAIFAGFGFSRVKGNVFEASALVAGVFLGASIWWLLLAQTIALFRKKIGPKTMLWINRISGTIISIVGLGILANLIV